MRMPRRKHKDCILSLPQAQNVLSCAWVLSSSKKHKSLSDMKSPACFGKIFGGCYYLSSLKAVSALKQSSNFYTVNDFVPSSQLLQSFPKILKTFEALPHGFFKVRLPIIALEVKNASVPP